MIAERAAHAFASLSDTRGRPVQNPGEPSEEGWRPRHLSVLSSSSKPGMKYYYEHVVNARPRGDESTYCPYCPGSQVRYSAGFEAFVK